MKKLRLLGYLYACLVTILFSTSTYAAGILYGTSNETLLEIDISSGSQTIIGSGTSGVQGLAFSPVPIPASVWLFGSGLLGLVGMARRKKSAPHERYVSAYCVN